MANGNGNKKGIKDYIAIIIGIIALAGTIWGYSANYTKTQITQKYITKEISHIQKEISELKDELKQKDVSILSNNFDHLETNVNNKLKDYGNKITKMFEWEQENKFKIEALWSDYRNSRSHR